MWRMPSLLKIALLIANVVVVIILFQNYRNKNTRGIINGKEKKVISIVIRNHSKILYDSKHEAHYYGPDMPIIFVGGFPRSGTTLMRVMLDAHPDIRCGEETRILPHFFNLFNRLKRNRKEWSKILKNNLNDETIDSATAYFTLEIIARHGRPAKVLCNKDPALTRLAYYLSNLFPNSKFVLMIRDGRAIFHSAVTRGYDLGIFDLNDPRKSLRKWSEIIKIMYDQCMLVGEKRCFVMHYEKMVLDPIKWTKKLLHFLQVPWNETVLHHETFIGKQISLSKTEISTDQVIKPVNTGALTKWVGHYAEDVFKDMAEIAPMLAKLGYDPNANPPNYGTPSALTANNTQDVTKNFKKWDERVAYIYNITMDRNNPISGDFQNNEKDRDYMLIDDETNSNSTDYVNSVLYSENFMYT